MEQPGGVSRFTIDLNGAFCFRTYPLLATENSVTKHHSLGAFRFGTFHLVAENSAAKDHSAVLRAGSQADAYPPGVPVWETRASRHFSFAHSIKTNRCALFLCVRM